MPPASLPGELTRRRRLFAFGVVLSVSFLHFVVSSFYYLLRGAHQPDPSQLQFRLLGALVAESTSLLVLWYVLAEQRRTWNDIGWNPAGRDILRGAGLLIATVIAIYPPVFCFQLLYRLFAAHYLEARSMRGLLGFGVSALSIAFVLLNPFFEELIVRAYTMSEVVGLGGSRTLAVLVSVAIQMSYNLYQGLLNGVVLVVTFTVFSIYYAKARRIAPVILAHFCFDAYALLSRSL